MSQYPPPGPYSAPSPLSPSDEKLWATLTHIGGIFFSVVPSLIAYLLLKDRGPFVREHSRTALNFQITMMIAGFVGGMLTFLGVGFLIVAAIPIVVIVFSIIAAVAANNGQPYRYPLAIEFLK